MISISAVAEPQAVCHSCLHTPNCNIRFGFILSFFLLRSVYIFVSVFVSVRFRFPFDSFSFRFGKETKRNQPGYCTSIWQCSFCQDLNPQNLRTCCHICILKLAYQEQLPLGLNRLHDPLKTKTNSPKTKTNRKQTDNLTKNKSENDAKTRHFTSIQLPGPFRPRAWQFQ